MTASWTGRTTAPDPGRRSVHQRRAASGPLPSLDLTGIDWLIIGGESGPGFRPMKAEWALDLIDRAHDAGVSVFVKQSSGLRHGMRGDLPDWAFALKEFPR